MTEYNHAKHRVDFLFPLVLFLVFTVSALTIVLMAANVYRTTVSQSGLSFPAQTCVDYIQEKVSQADANDAISFTDFHGCPSLLITQEHEGTTYYTVIYNWDDSLRELFVKDLEGVSPENGQKILNLQQMTIEPLTDHLYRISCTGEDGESAQTCITLRSASGKGESS